MKNIDLIEATTEDLKGVQPIPGLEIVIRNIRYRVVGAKPPKAASARWKRRVDPASRTWRILVEKADQPTP